MKNFSAFGMAFSLLTSIASAQTGPLAPGSGLPGMPAPGTHSVSGTFATGQENAVVGSEGGSSSGAAEQSRSQSGAGGQLITPAIVQSKPAMPASPVMVKAKTQNGVTYMCGGVGEEEATYMKQTAARDFDLVLTFTALSGDYLANVAVAIKDASGNSILETTCDAPMMLVDLPRSGQYRVQAKANGHSLNRTIRVKDGGRTDAMVFAWPRNAAGASTSATISSSAATGKASSGDTPLTGASGRAEGQQTDRVLRDREGGISGSTEETQANPVSRSRDSNGSNSGATARPHTSSGNGSGNDSEGAGGNTGATGSSSPYDTPIKGIR